MFSLFPRGGDGKTRAERRSKYEADRIAHAKRIMKPFFLRRLKAEVRLATLCTFYLSIYHAC